MPLTITKNVFSEELLKRIYDFSRDGKQPTKANFFGWSATVVGTSNAIFLFELEEDLKQAVAKELIDKGILKKMPKVWAANIYLMSRGSFIPWHDDGNHKYTCTVYLNKVWNPNWNGYFIYEDGQERKALIPEYNTSVSFIPPKMHTSTLTSIDAPLRETLQIFVDEE